MPYFHYQNGELFCEQVPVDKIASAVGTPFYLYSYSALFEAYQVFDHSFDDIPHLICYSMKANSSRAVLRTFINLGSGIDIVSGGELYRALKAGVSPERVVFSGVGKTETTIIQQPMAEQIPIAVQAAAPIPVQTESATSSEENQDEDSKYITVKSPIIGTFYRKPSPDKSSFVKVGDTIDVGDTVCIIEAMKLFNEVESEVAGKIVKVLVDDSSPVEFDQPLFLVDPS